MTISAFAAANKHSNTWKSNNTTRVSISNFSQPIEAGAATYALLTSPWLLMPEPAASATVTSKNTPRSFGVLHVQNEIGGTVVLQIVIVPSRVVSAAVGGAASSG